LNAKPSVRNVTKQTEFAHIYTFISHQRWTSMANHSSTSTLTAAIRNQHRRPTSSIIQTSTALHANTQWIVQIIYKVYTALTIIFRVTVTNVRRSISGEGTKNKH